MPSVPFDRAETLRSAEKLLRQGKMELAIAEYVRIVEDQPQDWNSANLLGDLYMRMGKTEKAVDQYVRIADTLKERGFLPKAGALYKKVLKIYPDDEHTLLQWAEVAVLQGQLADARNALKAVAERRRSRGDNRGVAQIGIRLGGLDPADFKARENGARARLEIGDTGGALDEMTALAADLQARGRETDAIDILQQASAIDGDDAGIRRRLIDACLAIGDLERARQNAATAEQLKSLAEKLEAAGHPDEAIEARRDAARLDPSDDALRKELARTFVARGDVHAAAEYLTAEMAGEDPRLLMTVAEIRLRSQDVESGLALIKRALEIDPGSREVAALLGWGIAAQTPEAGFRAVVLAADTAVAQSDWAGAAAALQEFVTRVPNHVPALLRLVEICVDGGLEATMQSAQAELTDAYLATGSASEARFIAEDLVAREPWNRANVERFRQALVLLGEPDPDGVIFQRLSGQIPFTSTDPTFFDLPPRDAAAPGPVGDEPEGGASDDPPREEKPAADSFELTADGADSGNILDEFERPATGLNELRAETLRLLAVAAEAKYEEALVLHKEGRVDEAIRALREASRLPRLRFQTTSLLGRIYRERQMLPQAIECFERAAEAPAPSEDEAYQLLYELADALETVGETARSLAICLGLQAEAGDYRDLAARIERLARVQTRG